MKQLINETINNLQDTFYEVSKYIGQNPELGHEEFKACKALTDVLKEQGFTVEIGTCDLPTAFTAVYDSQKPGPSFVFMV